MAFRLKADNRCITCQPDQLCRTGQTCIVQEFVFIYFSRCCSLGNSFLAYWHTSFLPK